MNAEESAQNIVDRQGSLISRAMLKDEIERALEQAEAEGYRRGVEEAATKAHEVAEGIQKHKIGINLDQPLTVAEMFAVLSDGIRGLLRGGKA